MSAAVLTFNEDAVRAAHPEIFAQPWWKKHIVPVCLTGLATYLVFCFFIMGFHRAAQDFRADNFRSATLDFYSYVEELKVNNRAPERTKIHRGWSSFDETWGAAASVTL